MNTLRTPVTYTESRTLIQIMFKAVSTMTQTFGVGITEAAKLPSAISVEQFDQFYLDWTWQESQKRYFVTYLREAANAIEAHIDESKRLAEQQYQDYLTKKAKV